MEFLEIEYSMGFLEIVYSMEFYGILWHFSEILKFFPSICNFPEIWICSSLEQNFIKEIR